MKQKHKLLIIAGAVVTVLAIGVAIWYLFLRPSQPIPAGPFNPHNDTIAKLLKDGEPAIPIQKAIYFAQLAQNYELVGNYDASLTNFLQAQAIVDSNKLGDQISYYPALADVYRLRHDNANVKLYLNKQIAYLQNFLKQHPNDEATVNSIKSLQKQASEL